MAFLAIEDRSGIVNVMLYPEVVQTYRRAVMSRFVLVEGEVRRDGAAMSILGKRVLALAVAQRKAYWTVALRIDSLYWHLPEHCIGMPMPSTDHAIQQVKQHHPSSRTSDVHSDTPSSAFPGALAVILDVAFLIAAVARVLLNRSMGASWAGTLRALACFQHSPSSSLIRSIIYAQQSHHWRVELANGPNAIQQPDLSSCSSSGASGRSISSMGSDARGNPRHSRT